MSARKKKPAPRKATSKKKSVTWKSESAFLSPSSRKKVIAIRFTHDGDIYLGGPPNDPHTLTPRLELKKYTAPSDLRTAKIRAVVEKGTALGHVAPHTWAPPRCVEYKTYSIGTFGVEKIRKLGLWSVTTPGNVVPVPRDLDLEYTNTGVLTAISYVSRNEIDLARWTREAGAGNQASMYFALELDRGAKGYIEIIDPENPDTPIVLR